MFFKEFEDLSLLWIWVCDLIMQRDTSAQKISESRPPGQQRWYFARHQQGRMRIWENEDVHLDVELWVLLRNVQVWQTLGYGLPHECPLDSFGNHFHLPMSLNDVGVLHNSDISASSIGYGKPLLLKGVHAEFPTVWSVLSCQSRLVHPP